MKILSLLAINSVFKSISKNNAHSRLVLGEHWSFSRINHCSSQASSPSSNSPKSCKDDMFDSTISNPYLKEKPQCILCRYNIEIDYKNIRLLSQFVSRHTGRLYDKHITGLCEKQHISLKKEFGRAIRFGMMSMYYRDLKFNKDPKLFDPTQPQRPNPY